MTWTLLVHRHLEQLKTLGLSPKTVELSRRWLERFLEFCEHRDVARPVALRPEHLGAFRRHLRLCTTCSGSYYSQSTVAQGLSRVRRFLSWATEHNFLLRDPSRDLVVSKPGVVLRPLLTPEQMEFLLKVPSPSTSAGLRDRAVLEVFYGTGLRRAECQALDLVDVNLRTQVLWVRRGKGGAERVLPVGESLAEALEVYLQKGRPHQARLPGQPALFLDRYGVRLSNQMLGVLVREHGRSAGVKVTPHLLRHAFAVHLMQNGAGLREIQEMLGHANLTTTQRYLQMSPQELAREHRRTHPRARRPRS